jgi:hypothetical protein
MEWSYSRKTVTRVFSDLKKQQIIQFKGSTLLIRKATLKPWRPRNPFLLGESHAEG